MNERLKIVNRKITKSTIEIQNLMSQLLPASKPLPQPYKLQYKQQQYNPQYLPTPQVMKKKSSHVGNKNSYLETNTSNKFQQTNDRFYSAYKQPRIQYQSYSQIKPHNKDKQKLNNTNRERSLFQMKDIKQFQAKKVKFAIGQNLYPSENLMINYNKVVDKIEEKQISKSILNIDYKKVLEHALNRQPLTQASSPQQIFNYFYDFSKYFKKPLIKKYKNCLYFGQSLDAFKYRTSKYSGFLYFYTQKIYYGYFQQQCKHGSGVQINLKTRITYKGTFSKGHKIGKFAVHHDEMVYQGYLNKGKFHGHGKLQTPISVYTGQFMQGMRNGQGQQYFYKSGLKLKGLFQMNKFCNTQQLKKQQKIKPNHSSMTAPKSRLIPRLSNIFQFSFHDSSQEDQFRPSKNFNIKRKLRNQPILKKQQYKIKNKQDDILLSASDDDPLPAPFRRLAFNK